MNLESGLRERRVAAVLDELHQASKRDRWIIARAIPAALSARLRGVPIMTTMNGRFADAFLGIPPEVGQLLYLTARAVDARHAVEFGTSFGISGVYLAAAMRDNGGRFVGSELEPHKLDVARHNLDRAGLAACSEVRGGDARQSLENLDGPIDLVLLDGWKDLYLPMLKQLKPKLRKGSVVFADNISTFKRGLAPYVRYVQSEANGFLSTTLQIGSGIEYSVYVG